MAHEPSPSFSIHSSLGEIAHRYDGFILDQYGVMHNGVQGLEGAPDCIDKLKRLGKKLIILSNSSALSSSTLQRLPKLGFDPNNFVGAVTSGEEAARYIRDHYSGRRALFLTWETTPEAVSPMAFVDYCGDITVTDVVEEADFVLLHGIDVLRGPGSDGNANETSLGHFKQTGDASSVIAPLLKECCAKGLPMLCVNPDFVYIQPDGTVAHMPGKIAKLYEEMGGSVLTFGKPHKEHFEACIRELGLPKERVVHIGDSLHHDVAGANAAGIPCVLVAGGVHREELGSSIGSVPSRESLEQLFASHKQTPTHVVPLLKI